MFDGRNLSMVRSLRQRHKERRFAELEGGQVGVEVGDGLDSAKIIFQRDVFIRSVGVFVRQSETHQHTRNL